jgi:hypothetical protein
MKNLPLRKTLITTLQLEGLEQPLLHQMEQQQAEAALEAALRMLNLLMAYLLTTHL